ncbi:hypothetical protein Q3G72_026881 [Acer saccharum]|nr:hypothetical protein Q3G72_026881 [Acer saccharum]
MLVAVVVVVQVSHFLEEMGAEMVERPKYRKDHSIYRKLELSPEDAGYNVNNVTSNLTEFNKYSTSSSFFSSSNQYHNRHRERQWRWRRRNRKQKISSKQRRENADETETVESLQFNFSTIKVATNDFSNDNKLGQGGFGAVYKGILSDGRIIAVKRLASNSEQGELEFKNEILLVARLQHRNLVRLLGFCLEGSERLLIYEFVPNSSLDNFIFDSIKRLSLDWEKRYKIIGGIARGILYLHEDSRLRIIHRDLKASNILIDQDMNPKISDFGMARLFERDQTQADTGRVVGTFGYMAPEYVLHGNFSVKSDVFSFGVLVLEIISGQKNSSFHNGEETGDLLTFAWENWRVGTALNVIDPILRLTHELGLRVSPAIKNCTLVHSLIII